MPFLKSRERMTRLRIDPLRHLHLPRFTTHTRQREPKAIFHILLLLPTNVPPSRVHLAFALIHLMVNLLPQ